MNADRRVLRALLSTALAVVVLSSGLAFAGGWPFRPMGGTTVGAGDERWVNETGDTMTGGLTFSGVATDIATVGNEDLVIDLGTGDIDLGNIGDVEMGDSALLRNGSAYVRLWSQGLQLDGSGNGVDLADVLNVEGDGAPGIRWTGCTSCAMDETSAERLEIDATQIKLDASDSVFLDHGDDMFFAWNGSTYATWALVGTDGFELESQAADATVGITLDVANAHTTGNLVEFQEAGSTYAYFNPSGTLYSRNILPDTTELRANGSSANKWASVHTELVGACKVSMTSSCAHGLSDSLEINDSTALVPEVSGAAGADLGSTTRWWNAAYLEALYLDDVTTAPACASATDQGLYLFNDTATDETNVCACLMDGTTSTFTRNLVLQVGASTKCN